MQVDWVVCIVFFLTLVPSVRLAILRVRSRFPEHPLSTPCVRLSTP